MAQDPEHHPPVAHLERKARLLLLALSLLLVGAVAYVLYARGAFERTQELVLIADDAEGVPVGLDMSFSGFPIGRVARIELAEDGTVRIIVRVPVDDARWLRSSSVFTMETGLVGGTKLRAFSGVLTDPPLEDGAERRVLRGDVTAEIPRMVASVRELVTNINNMTVEEAPLNASLRALQATAERLNGPGGVLGVALGTEAEAKKVVEALERTNTLLARLDGLTQQASGIAQRTDGMIARADQQVFGTDGLMRQTRAAVVQLDGLLADTRGTLKKMDAVLVEAQGIASNTREATTDLASLRAEVEASLRRIDGLVNEIHRKWPFARDTEIRLP